MTEGPEPEDYDFAEQPPTLFGLLPELEARSLYARILSVLRQTDKDDPTVLAEVEAIIQKQKDMGVR